MRIRESLSHDESTTITALRAEIPIPQTPITKLIIDILILVIPVTKRRGFW